jgi:hypothetical protein
MKGNTMSEAASKLAAPGLALPAAAAVEVDAIVELK